MFIQLNDGSLINTDYLDNLEKHDIDNAGTMEYYIYYILTNGSKRKELYNSESDRDDAYTSIRTSLLS